MDKTNIAVNIFNKCAEQYQEKFMDVGLYVKTLDLFCNNIKENGTVLELACGPGNITKHLLHKRPDLKIFGIDLAPNMITLAKTNNPTAEFQIMDCREIGNLQKQYDAILCGFCLPYLTKEETAKLFTNASELLNKDGVIYISTMEDDHANSGFRKGSTGEEIFMHYYTSEDLIQLLKKNGFNLVEIIHQDYPAQGETKTTDLIIIAEKENG